MNKVAQNKKIMALTDTIISAIEAETEEILADAEAVVKSYIPARYVKAALSKIEKMLNNEGIEVVFDKAITREALRKTASTEVTAKELHETIATIVNAIVGEMESVLEDAESVVDEVVAKFDNAERFEVESKLKSLLERRLASSKGIHVLLARAVKPSNKIAARIAAQQKK